MSSAEFVVVGNESHRDAAPWWHTILVLLPVAIASVAAAEQHGLPNLHLPGLSNRLSSYATVMLVEWLPVLFIWMRFRGRMGTLISGRWQTVGAFFRDLGFAVGFLIVTVPLVGLLASRFGPEAERVMAGVTPHTRWELIVWIVLAPMAGFCEELVFRGYLAQQFRAWTGSVLAAIILQGVAFGLAHGYYGRVMIVVMLQGWLLGSLAAWRKSLRPGMIAHGMQDLIGGIAAYFS